MDRKFSIAINDLGNVYTKEVVLSTEDIGYRESIECETVLNFAFRDDLITEDEYLCANNVEEVNREGHYDNIKK